MENILSTLDIKFRSFFDNDSTEPIEAKYPSTEWSAVSWSWCLLKDLKRSLIFYYLIRLIPAPLKNIVFEIFIKRLIDFNSYHHDCSRKIYLLKILNNIEHKKKIVLPECGPAGFEVLVAKMAGFEEIVTFDSNINYVNCFKELWPGIECYNSKSVEFDFNKYVEKNYYVLIPDWHHDNIENFDIPNQLKIEYSTPYDRGVHLSHLCLNDFLSFFSAINNFTNKAINE